MSIPFFFSGENFMKVLGMLDLAGGGLANFSFDTQTEWPENPKPGMAVFIDKRLMLCLSMDNDLPVWIPLTQQLTMHTHNQTAASSRWEIAHNLNAGTPLVQVYDADGEIIVPDSIKMVDANNTVILFPSPIAGTAVLIVGIESGLPAPTVAFTTSFMNSAQWVVVHNLGYHPAVRIYQGNLEVQPRSIVHDSNSQLTITFDSAQSGTVILY